MGQRHEKGEKKHEGNEKKSHEGNEKKSHEKECDCQGQAREEFGVSWNEGEDERRLKKADLKKNKAGHVVSRKRSARGIAMYLKNKKMQKWTACFIKARKALGIKGFCPCGGKTAKGKALQAKTRSLYK